MTPIEIKDPKTLVSDWLINKVNMDLQEMKLRLARGRRDRIPAAYAKGYQACLEDLGLLQK